MMCSSLWNIVFKEHQNIKFHYFLQKGWGLSLMKFILNSFKAIDKKRMLPQQFKVATDPRENSCWWQCICYIIRRPLMTTHWKQMLQYLLVTTNEIQSWFLVNKLHKQVTIQNLNLIQSWKMIHINNKQSWKWQCKLYIECWKLQKI